MSKEQSYYDVGGYSAISVIEAKLTTEQLRGFLLGTCIKYALRLNHKGAPASDAAKLAEYAKWLHLSFYTNGDNP